MNWRKILILLIVLLFALIACQPTNPPRLEKPPASTTEDGIRYTTIYIEGMPCIWVHKENGGYDSRTEYAGLDCDWSKHPSHATPTPADE